MPAAVSSAVPLGSVFVPHHVHLGLCNLYDSGAKRDALPCGLGQKLTPDHVADRLEERRPLWLVGQLLLPAASGALVPPERQLANDTPRPLAGSTQVAFVFELGNDEHLAEHGVLANLRGVGIGKQL